MVRSVAFATLFAAVSIIAGCARPISEAASATPANSKTPIAEVNVYSGRHYDSDIAIYDAFTRKTGIRVNLIEAGGDALIERLARESDASPADLFITADAGMLWRAKERGVLRPISDDAVLARAPAQFRDPEREWIGLSRRARIIIYNKKKGAPAGVETYGDLASPALKGQICVRSSTNIYNQSLLAGMIAHVGAQKAAEWTKAVVANFARKPEGNDTTQIEAVAAGDCGLSIVNTYYLARYVGADDARMKSIGERIGIIFPNQKTTGTHINISGAGVARYAPHAENAEALIGYLLSEEAQQAFAAGNNEYPIIDGVPATGPVAAFGPFRADNIDMAALGEHQTEAVKIFDEAGWQ